ncbi:MAG: hypothetical protein ABS35_00190 [Kaistia sp. SCN 65-12]|nr:MAG: hypothetical protein ABS35_00190 [Kaistia sp. SCN 65-12]
MSEFSDTIERLLAAECTPNEVRAIEAGGSSAVLWQKIADTGFQDSMVPESAGGAGLGLSDLFEVIAACGGHCVPLPLSVTMLVRAALAEASRPLPEGPITVAPTTLDRGDTIVCERVPYALTSRWVLVRAGEISALLQIDSARVRRNGIHASLEGNLEFDAGKLRAAGFPLPFDWRNACACLFAAQMAGAMDRLLTDSIRHANERSQFGKSIGKFQAIQQQISAMAEQVFSARMAAQLGCASASFRPETLLAAVAKARASEAAIVAAATAHAVHGAMGITEEYDLQLFTRRLHEWRLAFGSETYWNRVIGQSLLDSPIRSSVEFVRSRLSPSPVET